jgi:hypothetical protein
MDYFSSMLATGFKNEFMMKQCLTLFLFLLASMIYSLKANAQNRLVSEDVLKQVSRLTAQLPTDIHKAYEQYGIKKAQFDSLEQLLKEVYPTLADKMKKRSTKLNSMAGYNAEGATLLLLPPNQKMTSFFLSEWDKMDNLERVFNQQAPSFFGSKELYKAKGYLTVWDSVYRQRLPALVKYRDGVFKLVQAEIAYMKANEKMFASSKEDEKMQYVEAELSILQKLVLLGAKYKKMVIDDGMEKIEFCKSYPSSCQQ